MQGFQPPQSLERHVSARTHQALFSDNFVLKAELQQHVRIRLSLHAYLREIAFLAELPKTPSGKVQRFLLRQQ
jgi:acetyl-CoA synthetase